MKGLFVFFYTMWLHNYKEVSGLKPSVPPAVSSTPAQMFYKKKPNKHFIHFKTESLAVDMVN